MEELMGLGNGSGKKEKGQLLVLFEEREESKGVI